MIIIETAPQGFWVVRSGQRPSAEWLVCIIIIIIWRWDVGWLQRRWRATCDTWEPSVHCGENNSRRNILTSRQLRKCKRTHMFGHITIFATWWKSTSSSGWDVAHACSVHSVILSAHTSSSELRCTNSQQICMIRRREGRSVRRRFR